LGIWDKSPTTPLADFMQKLILYDTAFFDINFSIIWHNLVTILVGTETLPEQVQMFFTCHVFADVGDFL
jgi:hypothetical protein